MPLRIWWDKSYAKHQSAPTDVVIISIRRQDGEIIFNPASDCEILAGDILIAIGRGESLAKLNEMARGIM